MRTSLMMSELLLRNAKKRAADLGISVSELVQKALQNELFGKPKVRHGGGFKLHIPIVKGKKVPAIDIADRQVLYDFLESKR